MEPETLSQFKAAFRARLSFYGQAALPFTLSAIAQGTGMGDLRNKFRKLEETERIRAIQRAIEGKRRPPAPPRCQCGRTADQVSVMWAHQADRWAPVVFYCPKCLPPYLAPAGSILRPENP